MRDSFIFYKSFYDSISNLTVEQQAGAFCAIMEYVFYGREPEEKGVIKAIFDLVKIQIDTNNKKYESGRRGGRPKKEEEKYTKNAENSVIICDEITEQKPNHNQNKTKVEPSFQNTKPNVNVNDNVNDNDNVNADMKAQSESSAPPVILLPLNDKTEYPVEKEQTEQWTELYPSVDVIQELRNMRGWLLSNPNKRKTKRGIQNFITSWLSREQDKGKCYQKQGQKKENNSKYNYASLEKAAFAKMMGG